jgi:hypothetical protein
MPRLLSICICVFIYIGQIAAQPDVRQLEEAGRKMLESFTFSDRVKAGERFEQLVDSLISSGLVFSFSFDSVKSVSAVKPADEAFLIITWNIPEQEGRVLNFGRLIQKNGLITQLTDHKKELKKAEQEKLTMGKWYGVLYYAVERVKHKGTEYYVLLGYDAADAFTTGKVIEVLSFGKKGEVIFGAPIFTGSGSKKRVLFYYREGSAFSLRFDKSEQRILFDHLNSMEGFSSKDPAFMVPDFTVDEYRWKKGRYLFRANIDVRNEGKSEGNRNKPVEKGIIPRK